MLGARPESLNKDEAQVWGLGFGALLIGRHRFARQQEPYHRPCMGWKWKTWLRSKWLLNLGIEGCNINPPCPCPRGRITSGTLHPPIL